MSKINKKIRLSVGLLLSIITLSGLFAVATPVSAAACDAFIATGTVITGTPPTRARFAYSTNFNTVANGQGITTPVQTFNNEGTFPIQQHISGLSGNTTYFFRLEVTNNFGTENLNINSYTTPACTQNIPAPTVDIRAADTNIPYNNGTTILWDSTNATSCSGSGGTNDWAGTRPTSGVFGTGALTSTRTYTITCSNSSGSASDSVTVSVGSQPAQTCQNPSATNFGGSLPCVFQSANPSVTISANPSSVSFGSSSNIVWSSINATSCTATGGANGWSGGRNTSGTASTGFLTNTTTFIITCFGASGTTADTDSVTVSVGGQAQDDFPNVELRADDDDIDFRDNTILRWDSDDADFCTASGGRNGWSGNRSTSGSFNTGPLTNDTSYSITCSNSRGSDSDSLTISVEDEDDEDEDEDDPTVSLRADDTNLDSGDTTILRWSSTDADSCRGTGGTNGWSGSKSRSGSFNTGRLTNTEDYRIICTNDSGSDDDSVTIRVNDNLCQDTGAINYRGSLPCRYNTVMVNNQPTVSITADQTNIPFNAATTVRWNTVNATSCFASGGSIGWAGAKSIGPGSFYTGSLNGTATYVITCSNGSGSATDAVAVTVRGQVITTTTVAAPRPAPTSLVLITSSVDRNQPIVPTIDNTRPHPGDEINYTVTYQNIGTGAITNLNLRLDLPYEVDYMFSNPNNPIRSGNTLLFNLGTLRANGQGTVTVRVRVRDNIPAGTNLNFPAILSYTDPSGFPQSVTANVYAQVWTEPEPVVSIQDDGSVFLGASVLGAGFLPGNVFGWLLLLILILVLILLAKYLFATPGLVRSTTVTTVDPQH